MIGVVPSELTVLGGRPEQGKSSLIAQLVSIHCPLGMPVHVFSYEMRAGQFLPQALGHRLRSAIQPIA